MNLSALKIGTLVKAFDSIFQYLGNEIFDIIQTQNQTFLSLTQPIDVAYLEYLCLDTFRFEVTTAFDCGLDKKDLTIPEPIDVTGWVVNDLGYKFEPLGFEYTYAEDAWHQTYFWCDCKPCLNPKN